MWRAIAAALLLIVQLIERAFERKRIKNVQEEHDKIEEDPAEWMRGHFDAGGGGLRPDDPLASKQLGDVPAANADSADSAGVRQQTGLERDSAD